MATIHVEYLVVLFPAIASALAGFFIEGVPSLLTAYRRFGKTVQSILTTKEHCETLRDYAVSSSFVGGGIGIVFGFNTDSAQAYVLAGALFVAGAIVASALSKLLVEIGKRESSAAHRKMAGTVRSIVRHELSLAGPHIGDAAGKAVLMLLPSRPILEPDK